MKRLFRKWLAIEDTEHAVDELSDRVAKLERELRAANQRAEVLASEVESLDYRCPPLGRGRREARERLYSAGFTLIPF